MEAEKMKNKAHFQVPITLAMIGFVAGLLFPLSSVSHAQTIDELNQQIDSKRQQISELEAQKAEVRGQLTAQESQVNTVEGQLRIVENGINVTTLNITQTQTELEKTGLEIDQTKERIKQKEELIDTQKKDLAELLRTLYRQRNKSMLEVLLSDQTFADFYRTLKSVSSLETHAKDEIGRLNVLKHELEVQQEDLVGKQDELKSNEEKFKQQQLALSQQQAYQEDLLGRLNANKSETLASLNEIQQQIDVAESVTGALQREARQKIYEETGILPTDFTGQFIWPISSRVITSYFKDPSYRRYFGRDHYGIDIDTDQGTPIAAAADGIVIQVIPPVTTSLALISIQHGDEFITRYLHTSKVYVSEGDIVKQGEIIGLSGGLPGTLGAGSLYESTGDHLHFEIRKFSSFGLPIPVDPLSYLP